MRIAISGTHSVGKSTLAKDFVAVNPGVNLEPEPYRTLREIYPIKLGKQATRFCNGIQFFYNLSRIKQYKTQQANVIFDRAPVDFIAYSLYAAKYHETDIDDTFILSLIDPTREALKFIDYLVFVPITSEHLIEIEDDGIRPINEDYRREVDEIFKEIYYQNLYQIMPSEHAPKFIELWGDRQDRLNKLSKILWQDDSLSR